MLKIIHLHTYIYIYIKLLECNPPYTDLLIAPDPILRTTAMLRFRAIGRYEAKIFVGKRHSHCFWVRNFFQWNEIFLTVYLICFSKANVYGRARVQPKAELLWDNDARICAPQTNKRLTNTGDSHSTDRALHLKFISSLARFEYQLLLFTIGVILPDV